VRHGRAGAPTRISIYFNFRSPYCYLASFRMFSLLDDYEVELDWRPLGGWDGRSPPERAAVKLPIARQDVGRFARRMGVPFVPPPRETEPTAAAAVSLYAHEQGLLQPFVTTVMQSEWGEGVDIGKLPTLQDLAEGIGLFPESVAQAAADPTRLEALRENWREGGRRGVIGVPSFLIGDQIFWGNDRIDFVEDHLRELHLRRA
jgi:2-hydroxychromene-2-carboxylate isomerase